MRAGVSGKKGGVGLLSLRVFMLMVLRSGLTRIMWILSIMDSTTTWIGYNTFAIQSLTLGNVQLFPY